MYKLLNLWGDVIYVGLTTDLLSRISTHYTAQRWRSEIHRVEYEEMTTEWAMRQREAELIREHRPRHNVALLPPATEPIALLPVPYDQLSDEVKDRHAIAAGHRLSLGDRF